MSKWMEAGLWGLVSGSALVLGSLAAYYLTITQKTIAFIMAFGAGVLISALSFELMDVAYNQAGIAATT
ncbi:MAG: ZIP family zinc transporter, partial [Chitinophagaceae bacterium]